MSTQITQITIRIPDELVPTLVRLAADDHRSRTNYTEMIVVRHLQGGHHTPDTDPAPIDLD